MIQMLNKQQEKKQKNKNKIGTINLVPIFYNLTNGKT